MRKTTSSVPSPLRGKGSPTASAMRASTELRVGFCQQLTKTAFAVCDSSLKPEKTFFTQEVLPVPGGPNKNRFFAFRPSKAGFSEKTRSEENTSELQ